MYNIHCNYTKLLFHMVFYQYYHSHNTISPNRQPPIIADFIFLQLEGGDTPLLFKRRSQSSRYPF